MCASIHSSEDGERMTKGQQMMVVVVERERGNENYGVVQPLYMTPLAISKFPRDCFRPPPSQSHPQVNMSRNILKQNNLS
jgi:hypothetical protein